MEPILPHRERAKMAKHEIATTPNEELYKRFHPEGNQLNNV
jgi:hypothetical protein